MTKINSEQVSRVAELIRQMPKSGPGLNFYSFGSGDKEIVAADMYPPLNHVETINFFFFVCLHQFGFWYGNHEGYVKPLFGKAGGRRVKGSDLLWRVAMWAFYLQDTQIFRPENLANADPEYITQIIFRDDSGPIPFPDLDQRIAITTSYGQWLQGAQLSPSQIVIAANQSDAPLSNFLRFVQKIPPFSVDYLQKKSLLLAMALANRPEEFLKIKDPESWQPIVDYHLMRVSMRMGLIDRFPEEEAIRNRRWVDPSTEREIRSNTYRAVQGLIAESGKPMSFIDEKMWMARKYCPEMSEPDCSKCPFTQVCEKKTDLFQPVFRTTDY